MNNRILWTGLATMLATVVGSTAAHADRKMLVLIDASGSMETVRTDGTTRFDTAKSRAKSKIAEQLAIDATTTFAVYTFSETTSTAQTTGFVTAGSADTTIDGLDLFTVGGGNTPLAGSLCDAMDTLSATGATTKILQLASDGEENFTPSTNPCFGPFSTDPDPPYSTDSWENKVYNHVFDTGINVQIELFDPGPITGFAARAAAARDPEASLTAKTRLISAMATSAAVGDGPPTLADFFGQLALVSGGRLTVLEDTAPQLPVFADVDGNSCVDRSDALKIARAFGQSGPPQDNPLDLDADGVVGFADYALALANFTPGGCGTPDPYVARAPLVCSGGKPIVISGQTIGSAAITIDARIACQITIKNSLIVSGSNAINVLGTAVITVDNSILVGQSAVLSTTGATLLSAANTVFHGKRIVQGALVYIDRGGNTWE